MADGVRLAVLNLSYVAVGLGLLPLLGIARTPRTLLRRSGLAYLSGVAVVGIVAAHLALLNVRLALPHVAALAALSLGAALVRLRRNADANDVREPRLPFRTEAWIVAGAALLGTAALFVQASRAFAVRPLVAWDAWAIWGTKARALFELGGASGPVFTDAAYAPLQHPLLLPALDAIAVRTSGSFDARVVQAQLLLLAIGFVAAVWSLSWPRVPAEVLAPTLFALVAAPAVLAQLSSALADVPLAFFVALGVSALAVWLGSGERWCLACATLFLGAAMLTKPEGTLYAFAAFVAALAAVPLARRPTREVLIAVAAVAAVAAPWWIFLGARHVPTAGYEAGDLVDPGLLLGRMDRAWPAAEELMRQLVSSGWGYLPLVIAAALIAAALAERVDLGVFLLTWLAVAFVGLVGVFVVYRQPIDLILTWAAARTVTTLVVTGAAVAPLLAADAWRLVLARADETRAAPASAEPAS
jgi:hypothetical protein